MFHHHPPLTILGITFASLQRPRLLKQRFLRVADSPFGPYPLPLTHTALAADTLHTPQRRIESLSSCAGVRFLSLRLPILYTLLVVCPAGQAQVPDSRSISKSSLGKYLRFRAAGQLRYQIPTGFGECLARDAVAIGRVPNRLPQ